MNGENEKKDVPYIVFEGELARAERHIKRLWIALLATIVSLVICIISFLWYLNLYDFESYEVVAEGDGHASYIGNDGDINYGGESDSAQENEEKPQSN